MINPENPVILSKLLVKGHELLHIVGMVGDVHDYGVDVRVALRTRGPYQKGLASKAVLK